MSSFAPSRLVRGLHAGALVLMLLGGCATMGAVAGGEGGGGGGGGGGKGVGEPMPDLAVEGFWDKKEVRLSSLRGKVVLLDIWASWCVPCRDEMPTLDSIARRLQGKGVEVVAVSIDEDRSAAEEFLKKNKKWSLTVAHDPAGTVPDRLQPTKMPTSYVIDRAGVLRHINAGFAPADGARIEAQLSELAAN